MQYPVEGKPKQQGGEHRFYADDNPASIWTNCRIGEHGSKALFRNDSSGITSVESAQQMLSQASTIVADHLYISRKQLIAL